MANAENRRPKYLRKASVGNRYDVGPRTIDRMSRDGRLPLPHYRGKLPLWSSDELDAADAAASAKATA
jgi:hypothetical protein